MPAVLALIPAIAVLGGCHEHFGAPHRVVHGRPVSVFATPVGYSYPEIANRNRPMGYRPLPTPAQRPIDVSPPAASPKAMRKQSTLAPKIVVPSAPAKPTVEVVPRQDEADGRATTQMRR